MSLNFDFLSFSFLLEIDRERWKEKKLTYKITKRYKREKKRKSELFHLFQMWLTPHGLTGVPATLVTQPGLERDTEAATGRQQPQEKVQQPVLQMFNLDL